MSDAIITTDDYRALITDLKARIQSAQIKAAVTVNTQRAARRRYRNVHPAPR